MDQEKYDLLFSGQVAAGFELDRVKKNVQLLFRIDEAKVDVLFSGKPIALKKGMDAETANKYRVAMKKAGALVSLVQSDSAAAPSPPAQPKPPSVAPKEPPAPSTDNKKQGAPSSFDTSLGAQAPSKAQPKVPISAPDFGLAAAGSDLLRENEKPAIKPVVVDISSISVAPQGGNLVKENEMTRTAALEIDVPDFDVAPAGSDVLTEVERPKVVPVQVDTSSLSISPVGQRLSDKPKAAPPPPNVDHIKLK